MIRKLIAVAVSLSLAAPAAAQRVVAPVDVQIAPAGGQAGLAGIAETQPALVQPGFQPMVSDVGLGRPLTFTSEQVPDLLQGLRGPMARLDDVLNLVRADPARLNDPSFAAQALQALYRSPDQDASGRAVQGNELLMAQMLAQGITQADALLHFAQQLRDHAAVHPQAGEMATRIDSTAQVLRGMSPEAREHFVGRHQAWSAAATQALATGDLTPLNELWKQGGLTDPGALAGAKDAVNTADRLELVPNGAKGLQASPAAQPEDASQLVERFKAWAVDGRQDVASPQALSAAIERFFLEQGLPQDAGVKAEVRFLAEQIPGFGMPLSQEWKRPVNPRGRYTFAASVGLLAGSALAAAAGVGLLLSAAPLFGGLALVLGGGLFVAGRMAYWASLLRPTISVREDYLRAKERNRDIVRERGENPLIEWVIARAEKRSSRLRAAIAQARAKGDAGALRGLLLQYEMNQDYLSDLRLYRQHADYVNAGATVEEDLSGQEFMDRYPQGQRWINPVEPNALVFLYSVPMLREGDFPKDDTFDQARGFETDQGFYQTKNDDGQVVDQQIYAGKYGSWMNVAGGRAFTGRIRSRIGRALAFAGYLLGLNFQVDGDTYLRGAVAREANATPGTKGSGTYGPNVAENSYKFWRRINIQTFDSANKEGKRYIFVSQVGKLKANHSDGSTRTPDGTVYTPEERYASRLQGFSPGGQWTKVKVKRNGVLVEIEQPSLGELYTVRTIKSSGEIALPAYRRAALEFDKEIARLFAERRFAGQLDQSEFGPRMARFYAPGTPEYDLFMARYEDLARRIAATKAEIQRALAAEVQAHGPNPQLVRGSLVPFENLRQQVEELRPRLSDGQILALLSGRRNVRAAHIARVYLEAGDFTRAAEVAAGLGPALRPVAEDLRTRKPRGAAAELLVGEPRTGVRPRLEGLRQDLLVAPSRARVLELLRAHYRWMNDQALRGAFGANGRQYADAMNATLLPLLRERVWLDDREINDLAQSETVQHRSWYASPAGYVGF